MFYSLYSLVLPVTFRTMIEGKAASLGFNYIFYIIKKTITGFRESYKTDHRPQQSLFKKVKQ